MLVDVLFAVIVAKIKLQKIDKYLITKKKNIL